MNRIAISSALPASTQVIWPLLTRIETLRYIAAPLATFSPLSNESSWNENTTLQFRLRILGLFPVGVHTIFVQHFDLSTRTVHTRESNRWVPVWNHTILLEPTLDASVMYTDIIEIDAGWKTGIVSLWSKWFYRHRQRRWKRLLNPGKRPCNLT